MIADTDGNVFALARRDNLRVWVNIATGEEVSSRTMRARFAPSADSWKGSSLAEIARFRAERDEFFSNGKERNKRRPCAICGKTDSTLDMSVNTTMMTFQHVSCDRSR